ncbi:MAG: hypothetical protein U9N30_10670 [Campylobacterota bacterium]|nr:hypothetical protein [Campylobacterota bacterium]
MKHTRDGAKVNRFFTLATIVIMAAVMSLYVRFLDEMNQNDVQKEAQNSGLKCQQEVVCFDKVFDAQKLKEAIALYKKGNYTLHGEFEYSQYMPTELKEKINPKNIENYFLNTINITPNPKMQKIVDIYYEVIENDKLHPNKKNSKSKHCKLYAGYLLTSFKVNGKNLFRMQIDFNHYDEKEIQQRINCTLKAFLSHE